jgi:hypothetical protein
MFIKSIDGFVLYETAAKTMRRALEEAISSNIDLNGADLRKTSLRQASLDGLKAKDACLWGADLTGADITMADLSGCDLRNACLENACLAHSNLTGAHLEGAFFSKALLEGADLSNIRFSCASLFDCDLRLVQSLNGATFVPDGEVEVALRSCPVVIKGLPQNLVIMENECLQGGELLRRNDMNPQQEAIFSILNSMVYLLKSNRFWQNAKTV